MPAMLFIALLVISLGTACAKKSSTPRTAAATAVLSDEFSSNCKTCHGSEGQGVGSYPVLEDTSLSYNEFLSVVRDGQNDMPAFTEDKYPDEAAENDHDFLKE